jgi:hypothetical protein
MTVVGIATRADIISGLLRLGFWALCLE